MTGLAVYVATRPQSADDGARLEMIQAGLPPDAAVVTIDAGTDVVTRLLAHAAASEHRFVAFVDEHVYPVQGWLDALGASLHVDDRVAGASAAVQGVGSGQPHDTRWNAAPNRLVHASAVLPDCFLLDAGWWRSAQSTGAPGTLAQALDRTSRIWVTQPRATAVAWRPRDLPPPPQKGEPPHVLVLDACTPTPDRDSGSADTFNYMRLFRQMGWQVTFAPATNLLWFGPYTEAMQDLGIACVCAPAVTELSRFLEDQGDRFDLVMICRVDTAVRYLDAVVRCCPRAATMFVTVDLHFLRLQREAELTGDRQTALRAAETTRLELDIVDRTGLTIAISEAECALLRELRPNARVHQLPIVRAIPGRRREFDERKDIAFIGGYRHPPNVDAVTHFLEQVWPHVRGRLPGVSFHIVGADAPPSLQSVSEPGAVFRGHVPDLSDVLDNVRLTVAPLRYGAGQKGKIVSSLSYGVPVVTTPVGAEGMQLVDGVHALVRSDPRAFAEAVVEAYQSEPLWARLSTAGLALIERDFSLHRGRAMLEQALTLLDRPALSRSPRADAAS